MKSYNMWSLVSDFFFSPRQAFTGGGGDESEQQVPLLAHFLQLEGASLFFISGESRGKSRDQASSNSLK